MEGLKSLGILGPNLLFQIASFLVMVFILNRLLYKPVLRMFDARKERISEGLATADRVREEAAAERERLAAQMAEERRESQERLRDAVGRGEEAARQRLAEANAEAERIVANAHAEADAIRSDALEGARPALEEAFREMAARLRAELDTDAMDRHQDRAPGGPARR